MGVAGIILARHRGKRIAQVAPVGRKAGLVVAAPVVVETAVVPVAGQPPLLGLQLHQRLDLGLGGLRVRTAAAAARAVSGAAVRRPGQFPKV